MPWQAAHRLLSLGVMPRGPYHFHAISNTWGLALVIGVAAGCSAADPGVEKLVRGQGVIYEGGTNPGLDGGKTDGSMMGTDGGMTDGGGGTNAFTGAPAYMSGQPATSARQQHMNNMVGVTPSKNTACLTCHTNGGAAVEFMFAGTVFLDQAGTMPAANHEIRLRGSDGVGYIGRSDADGNFWFNKGMANIAFPATTGGRNMNQTALMTGTITTGDCNDMGCHGGGQGAIHVP
jgi:hypothetical protein